MKSQAEPLQLSCSTDIHFVHLNFKEFNVLALVLKFILSPDSLTLLPDILLLELFLAVHRNAFITLQSEGCHLMDL